MSGVRYRCSRGCVFSLKFHLVWCPKYRRKVLLGPVIEDPKTRLYQKAAELTVTIEALEVTPALAAGASMQDHVHLFVSAEPTVSPQRLWSRSYDVGSVGQVSEETVKGSIETQKGT